jgi:hypothetical protein
LLLLELQLLLLLKDLVHTLGPRSLQYRGRRRCSSCAITSTGTGSTGDEDNFQSSQTSFHLIKTLLESRARLLHSQYTILDPRLDISQQSCMHLCLYRIYPPHNKSASIGIEEGRGRGRSGRRFEEHQFRLSHLSHEVREKGIIELVESHPKGL